ncbi:uncharacterized protein B0P05DRAFT_540434 [Gilbertella persicaria]|uniref:uncharacterized protein n=1 Tax=Gilbertella persicaria TaxID=101096 RepID=UPI002220907B|nr:uncharacterized protein B0P05DRAFT_540434 [Gilbertella persicaria]KAI8080209.1 hypothetical protein B0P05DRAFT_540434 [Gilbertella persicaria]
MENIELSKQPSKRSIADSNVSSHSQYEKHDDEMTAASGHHSRSSIVSGEKNVPTAEPVQRKSVSQRILTKLPPFPLIRIIVKASIAILIGLLFVFEKNCRSAMGSASILVPIGTLLYFPIRPIGVQIEASLQGTFGALVGSAWSFLGMYLANLARDPTIPSPVQPNSSAILAVFMFIGVFGLTYVRTKFAQANFATIFASMIVAFCLTQASVIVGFQPTVVYTFLKPIATATAIGLLVDLFLWPDDSITKYMGILSRSLKEYNGFFEEHAKAFLLTESFDSSPMTLPTLHQRLQNSILKLIDCKREVQREILFNRLAHRDINDITRHVKLMRTPLHGIGLSVIAKTQRLEKMDCQKFREEQSAANRSEHKQRFIEDLETIRKVSQELAETCVLTLNECVERLMRFSGKPRSVKSTILWPFPRIHLSDYHKSAKEQNKEEEDHAKLHSLSGRLNQAISKFENGRKKSGHLFVEPGSNEYEESFNSILQVIYLFQFNLMEHALQLQSFVACIENIELKRTKRRLWLPRLPLKKWFRSISIDANFGAQVGSTDNAAENHGHDDSNNNSNTYDLTLSQTVTRPDTNGRDEQDLVRKTETSKAYPRDPDVNAPETAREKFFYAIYRFIQWLESPDCAFAIKTAGGFVLLSLPAFLQQSATWFFAWRGQWATITLMMWMIPVAGMFVFTVILRVMGTVLGGVVGIIVWEITRGNPYGIVVLTFFVMMPLYFIFFTSQVFNVVALMTQMTLLLVICYEYQYVVGGTPNYDSIEVVAGKRMLLVIIGVTAAAILALFPKPVTGRVELRKRISRTIRDLGRLFSILAGDILTDSEPTDNQRKAFRKLVLGIRRQIADEQTYLKLTKLEPPLRGKFPIETYATLVEKVDNMADLLQGMAYASQSIDKSWRLNLFLVMREERKEYLATMLTTMKLLSATLASKMALPPYFSSPLDMRKRFAHKMGDIITKYPKQLDNGTFPNYCAYGVNSYMFCSELAEALECVEKLVGVEDPEQWLLLHA